MSYDPIVGFSRTGGPKYRDHIHDFKASVFGYAGAGVVAMVIIHFVVLTSPLGHAKWLDVVGSGVTSVTSTSPATAK
jgi:hypothetical protein